MNGHVYSLEEMIAMITPILRKYKAEQAILFGSYARQEADAQSDIDLLVELHRATGKPVDVYELREVNAGTDFFRTIFSEGVKIA